MSFSFLIRIACRSDFKAFATAVDCSGFSSFGIRITSIEAMSSPKVFSNSRTLITSFQRNDSPMATLPSFRCSSASRTHVGKGTEAQLPLLYRPRCNTRRYSYEYIVSRVRMRDRNQKKLSFCLRFCCVLPRKSRTTRFRGDSLMSRHQ